VLKGYVDIDGDVDVADITAFIADLQVGIFQAEADCGCGGNVDFAGYPGAYRDFAKPIDLCNL